MVKNYRPGPAKYTLPPTIGFIGQDLRKIRLPAYSFGLRLRNYHDIVGPAPNEYVLSSTIGGQDKTVKRAPAYSIHERIETKDHMAASPGPSKYVLPSTLGGQDKTVKRAPAYSIYEKIETKDHMAVSPGPSKYAIPSTLGGQNKTVKRAPAYSISEKLDTNEDHIVSPAPNEYVLSSTLGGQDKTVKRAPAYSIHEKIETKDHMAASPGPSKYVLPSTLGGQDKVILSPVLSSTNKTIDGTSYRLYPEYSSFQQKLDKVQKLTVKRAPAHSIHEKIETKDHTVTPAPNAYAIQNCKISCNTSGFTIGVRFKNTYETEEA